MLQGFRRLPFAVARFYAAATVAAIARRDRWSLVSATRPRDLRVLLDIAGDARTVVEVGTGPGWTTIAFALAQPERTVTSFDVQDVPAESYARLARGAAGRVRFLRAGGSEGTAATEVRPDFLFIDSSHEYDETLSTFTAWRPRLAPGATVVFHDYGNPDYPGVQRAVDELELAGEARDGLYVWRGRV